MSKRLVLTDTNMGVNVYFDTDGSFWVRFLGVTKWGRRLYRPAALDLSITNGDASVTRLVVNDADAYTDALAPSQVKAPPERKIVCPGPPYCSCGRKAGQSHLGPVSG